MHVQCICYIVVCVCVHSTAALSRSLSLCLSSSVAFFVLCYVFFSLLTLFHLSCDLLGNVLISFSALQFSILSMGIYYSFWLTSTLIDVAIISCGSGCRVAIFSSPYSLLLVLFTLLLLRHCRLLFFFPFFHSLHSPVTRIEKYIRKLLCTRANMEYRHDLFVFSFKNSSERKKKKVEREKAIKIQQKGERERE